MPPMQGLAFQSTVQALKKSVFPQAGSKGHGTGHYQPRTLTKHIPSRKCPSATDFSLKITKNEGFSSPGKIPRAQNMGGMRTGQGT